MAIPYHLHTFDIPPLRQVAVVAAAAAILTQHPDNHQWRANLGMHRQLAELVGMEQMEQPPPVKAVQGLIP